MTDRHAGHDADGLEVLGGRANQGRAPDVDLLYYVLRGSARSYCLGERVEVDHDQVERLDPVLGERREVVGLALVGQDPGVDPRVQRLDPALQHLRETGHVGHSRDRDALFAQPGCRRAR